MSEVEPLAPHQSKKTYKSFATLVFISINISLSSFYFGYHMVYMSSIDIKTIFDVFNIKDVSTSIAKGVLNGAIPIGGLIGALSSSLLIGRFSRRKNLLIVNVIAIIAGGGVFIPNFYSLIIFRVIQGFVVGFNSAIAPLIIKELAPKQISGTLGTFTQLFVTLGVFIGVFFSLILKLAIEDNKSGKYSWFYVFAFPLLIVILQTMILIFVYPFETPKYLLMNNCQQEAKKLLQFIYKQQYVEDVLRQKMQDLESNENRRDVHHQQTLVSEQAESFTTTIPTRKLTTLIAIHLAMLQQVSGINAIVVYGGQIASSSLQSISDYVPSLLNFLQVITTFATSYIISKLGRKTILQIGTAVECFAVSLVMVGFMVGQKETIGQVMILIGLFLYMAMFGLSLGPVVWLYIPEIVQPRIVSYSTAANWISAFIIITFFPIITESLLGNNPKFLFLFFAVWCAVSFVINMKYVVETKDKSQRQIRQDYNKL